MYVCELRFPRRIPFEPVQRTLRARKMNGEYPAHRTPNPTLTIHRT